MAPSRLDGFYRKLLFTRFFDKGWGKPENLQRLFEFRKVISRRETCFKLIPHNYPIEITRKENLYDYTVLEGKFTSPLELYLPGVVPLAAQHAHFQVILPNKWTHEKHKPMCIHLAGTGDHYFWRRRNFLARPLLKEANIGAIILENPFYGLRKPDDQVRSNLHNVSDIFVMGGCLILECLVLLHWCEKNGFGPLGVTGLSMGGHMASLAATNWPKPLVLVPCLSWSTAAAVFTTGVMSQSINWDILETQYFSDGKYSDRLSKMVTVIDEAFTAGKKFITHFDQSMLELKKDISVTKLHNNSVYMMQKLPKSGFNENIDVEEHNCNENRNMHRKIYSNNTVEVAQFDNQSVEQSTLTKLMEYILPQAFKLQNTKIDTVYKKWWEREALQFMRGMMDECTHLKNFSVPYDTSLIIAVCAKEDAYVPRDGCSSLEEIWPGAEVRYLDAGHVSAYVLHQKLFRSSIIEAFERAKTKADKGNYNNNMFHDDLKPTLTFDELLEKYKKMKDDLVASRGIAKSSKKWSTLLSL